MDFAANGVPLSNNDVRSLGGSTNKRFKADFLLPPPEISQNFNDNDVFEMEIQNTDENLNSMFSNALPSLKINSEINSA